MQNHLYKYDKEFTLESGGVLPGFQLSYHTYGRFRPEENNVIWICHALTANSDAAVWWDGLVGPGKLYDPEKHFIICANILGGCYGSTGPLDVNPVTKKKYFWDFPQVTIRDMAAALELLRQHLGITRIHTCVGGSLGAMQAMEWAIMNPGIADHLILMAASAWHSPWGIAFNESQRLAIQADPTWKNEDPNAGRAGLRAARATALLSYRNYEAYWHTQSETDIEKIDHFKSSTYQQYQGDKLVQRFNMHSYWYLTKAMDSHHVGRARGGAEKALSAIQSHTAVIGIRSDYLFPVSEQKYLAQHIPGAIYEEIDSFYGHDGFLIEAKAISEIVTTFYHQNQG